MNCEIEFLPVGEKSRAGDAIVVRYGEENAYGLMLIDGGTEATGDEIIAHIRSNFGQNSYFNHVLLSHTDGDHASGLRDVLRQVRVVDLWLNIPWDFAQEAINLFSDKRWTVDGLTAKVREAYPVIIEIVELAVAQGTKLHFAFAGTAIGPFTVLSPSRAHYVHLVPQFGATPDPDQAAIEANGMWIGKAKTGIAKAIFEAVVTAVRGWIPETWLAETLRDDGVTSATNESSVILYANTSDRRYLLTGDAGIHALNWAADFADAVGYLLQSFTFIQIPHHGSRRNVGPTILNRIVGPIRPFGGPTTLSAFVSCPKDDDQHPRKVVTNAFLRRGATVIATQGTKQCYHGGFAAKPGYYASPTIPFANQVEDYS